MRLLSSLADARPDPALAGISRQVVGLYVGGIILGEVLLVAVGPVASLIVHGVLLTLLAIHSASLAMPERQVFSVLMLHPLLRAVSLGLPIGGLSPLVHYALAGLPMWVAMGMIVWVNKIPLPDLGFKMPRGPLVLQLGLAVLGWPLGLVAMLIVNPTPAIASLSPVALVAGIVVISVFSSAVEEVYFRGFLQTTLYRTFGNYGILCAGLMFLAAYLGTLSIPYIILMGALGMLFGWAAHKSGSLWGVIAAHSLLKCGALLIWPFIILR